MVGCTGAGQQTEFEFVASLVDRELGQCRGPLLSLDLSADATLTMLESVGGTELGHRIWEGTTSVPVAPSPPATLVLTHRLITLCAAHWMDISYVSGHRGATARRPDWFDQASALLLHICRAADWDCKEIANMLTWQRVLLT